MKGFFQRTAKSMENTFDVHVHARRFVVINVFCSIGWIIDLSNQLILKNKGKLDQINFDYTFWQTGNTTQNTELFTSLFTLGICTKEFISDKVSNREAGELLLLTNDFHDFFDDTDFKTEEDKKDFINAIDKHFWPAKNYALFLLRKAEKCIIKNDLNLAIAYCDRAFNCDEDSIKASASLLKADILKKLNNDLKYEFYSKGLLFSLRFIEKDRLAQTFALYSIANGADPKMTDENGDTVLHHAAKRKLLDVAAYLKFRGAEHKVKNGKDKEPFDELSFDDIGKIAKKCNIIAAIHQKLSKSSYEVIAEKSSGNNKISQASLIKIYEEIFKSQESLKPILRLMHLAWIFHQEIKNPF
jgi:hypothetical protein